MIYSIYFVLGGCRYSLGEKHHTSGNSSRFRTLVRNLKRKPRRRKIISSRFVEIPLIKLHSYEVTQLDSTVKGLLERWGEEARMSVIYDHPIDFTLYKKVKSIHATELRVALNELTQLYSDKNMVFYIQDNVIMAHGKMEEGEGSKYISNKKK
ncbi:hypothetical protein [Morococcus cerebrosus]|uniref:hypothetical protein n=1 Tax=Morococcus cerebrosus TaxID=1056807 RepID=UPI0012DFEC51|nr:hypothetical protein [Morococcus cerebrosus]